MSVSSLPGHYHSGPGSFSPGFADAVIYNEEISQSITLSDENSPKAVFPRNLSQSLSFSETNMDSDNLPQVLSLSDDVDHYLSPLLTVSQTLSFLQSLAETGIFNHNVTHSLPITMSIDHVKKQAHMVMTSVLSSITIPAPIFGDSDNLMDTLIFKRAMDGTKYTYCNRVNQEKLSWTWNLAKKKADEFKAFLLLNDLQEIVISWRGEKWKVIIPINNYDFRPIAKFDNSHEQVEVSCDFEGVRLV